VQRREADLGLELATGCTDDIDAKRDRVPRGDIEQRGLADAGVPDQHERLAGDPRALD